MDPIKKSILDAKMDKSQIHDIILGGGSTRIPKVQKLLSDKLKDKMREDVKRVLDKCQEMLW
uniref:Uncharacterized protein n=2 Tax=Meloidogyne TaxID=189290 RepID=A0A6V7XU16_MELEN|nr:unnamed protein product [Meloidogyne enterolobii]CAD2202798.1 unnamed protein product [Meloidogyne enterolobii]